MAISRKLIWIIIGIIIIVGSFVGLIVLSNITGNAITGSSINTPLIEQESFKINDDINEGEENDGSQNSG